MARPIAYFSTPRYIREIMVSLIPFNRDVKVLDAGCGRGEFLETLRRYGYWNVTGIEISREYCEECRRRFPEYRIICGDFLRHDERYDVIIGNPPYMHYSEISDESLRRRVVEICGARDVNLYYAFIIKAIQLLKEDGLLIFITPIGFLYSTYAKKVRESLEKGSLEMIIDLGEVTIDGTSQNLGIIVFRKGRLNLEGKTIYEKVEYSVMRSYIPAEKTYHPYKDIKYPYTHTFP